MDKTAFFLMRSGMGVNFIFHAVNRFYYGPGGFSSWMVTAFKDTFFPPSSIYAFSAALPYLEGVIGLALLAGFRTRIALVTAAAVMIALIVGSCMINQWDWVTFQVVYLIGFYILMKDIDSDRYSVDRILSKTKYQGI